MTAPLDPPKRHLTRYFRVLSSHCSLRSQVVPAPTEPASADEKSKPAGKSKYIPWAELLRRTFGIETVCLNVGPDICALIASP
jgi:hypothetical protein